VVHFLETDSETKLIAKPQLRGAEGQKITLNLGDDIPVPSTVFTPLATGGANTNPLTSFTYRTVGIVVEMTPRVTFEGEVILDLSVENSTRSGDVNIAGQNLPSFGTRKVVDAAASPRRRIEPARRAAPRGRPARAQRRPRAIAPADSQQAVLLQRHRDHAD
jgi:type II secretory pathway component GspD/PulD (secretin)